MSPLLVLLLFSSRLLLKTNAYWSPWMGSSGWSACDNDMVAPNNAYIEEICLADDSNLSDMRVKYSDGTQSGTCKDSGDSMTCFSAGSNDCFTSVYGTSTTSQIMSLQFTTLTGRQSQIWGESGNEQLSAIDGSNCITAIESRWSFRVKGLRFYYSEPPSSSPTESPSSMPTQSPSQIPTSNPSSNPTIFPTINPSKDPTFNPSEHPLILPTVAPTKNPTSIAPNLPSPTFTNDPSSVSALSPSAVPTNDKSLSVDNVQSTAITIIEATEAKESAPFRVFDGSIAYIIFGLIALFALLCTIWIIIVCCYKKRKIVKKETLGKVHTDIEFNKVTSMSSLGLSSMNSDDDVIDDAVVELMNTPDGDGTLALSEATRYCAQCGFVISKSHKFCSECGHFQNEQNNVINKKKDNDIDANMDKELQLNTGSMNSELLYMNNDMQTIGNGQDNDDSVSTDSYIMNEVETIVDSVEIEKQFSTEGMCNF